MEKVKVYFDYENEEYVCMECNSVLFADEGYCPCCGNELDWSEF